MNTIKSVLYFLAILSFIYSIILTGLGGMIDTRGAPLRITKEHAWNDGLYLLLLSIFFIVVANTL